MQLIEQIDNANSTFTWSQKQTQIKECRTDITSMNMWEPLIKLLESPSEAIKVNALWVLGTAVQNNPKAQEAVSPQFSSGRVLIQIYSLWPNRHLGKFCH